MDHSGIGSALIATSNVYFKSARQSGRTTQLLDSVKDGDRIIFATHKEARRFEQLAKEKGKCIEVVSVGTGNYGIEFIHQNLTTSKGRTFFDHGWVEARYLHVLEDERKFIDKMQNDLSTLHAHEDYVVLNSNWLGNPKV